MLEFLEIILARPSKNFDREYLVIEFHSKLAAMKFYGFENGRNFTTLRQRGGALQLFIRFFCESVVIFSRFFKISDGICAVYI